MIELRWKAVFVPMGDLHVGRMEKILQFRYDISATQGVWMVNPEDRMSEWKDVPTVSVP